MGGKSSDAQAPDPRLVDAQIRGMNAQEDAMSRILDNYEQFAPLQRQQMQFGMDTAREAYTQSQEDRNWALGRRSALTGLQDRMVQEATEANSGAREAKLVGQSDADVDAAFSSARGQGLRMMGSYGVNPMDGRFAATGAQMDTQHALAKATARNKVREAARAEGLALTDRASNALSGYPAMGSSLSGAGAGFGGMGLGYTGQASGQRYAGLGAYGGMGGSMGQNATSMWGAQASYKTAQDQLGGSWAQDIGALVGAGASLYSAWNAPGAGAKKPG